MTLNKDAPNRWLIYLFTVFDFVLFHARDDSEPSKCFKPRRQTVLDNQDFEITFWLKVFKYFHLPTRYVYFEYDQWMEYFRKQNTVNKKTSELIIKVILTSLFFLRYIV